MNTRERIRAIIRSEIGRANPIEEARGALELMAEASVRYRDVDGEPRITIVDRNGEPRLAHKDGHSVPFTLADLIEELRAEHPSLFKSGQEAAKTGMLPSAVRRRGREGLGSTAGPSWTGEEDQLPEEDDQLPDDAEIARDWLNIGTQTAPEPEPRRPRRFAMAAGPAPAAWGGARRPAERLPVRGPRKSRMPALRAVAGISGLAIAGSLLWSVMATPGDDPPGGSGGTAPVIEEPPVTGAVRLEAPPPDPITTADGTGLRGRPEVLDTSTLYLGNTIIPLFGVEWARGGGNPDDLTRYLAGREVECRPVPATETYRCAVDGQDLSRVVLYNGGGRATADATPDLKLAEQHARSAQIGMWRQ